MENQETKHMKRLLITLLSIICVASAYAQKGWKWSEYGSGVRVVIKLNNDYEELVIPEHHEFKGKVLPVVDLMMYEGEGHVKKLICPSTLRGISVKVDVEEIELKEGINILQSHAFFNIGHNESLKRINIPKSVKVIGQDAFAWCSGLEQIVLPEGLKSIGRDAFKRSALKEIIIPNSVESIGDNAFADCASLKSVTVPDYVKTVGKNIFNNSPLVEIKFHHVVWGDWLTREVMCEDWGKKYEIWRNRTRSYSHFVELHQGKLLSKVEEWQKRSEFETVEEWKNRVNTGNRDKYVKTLLDQLRQDYISEQKPKYQADNQFQLKRTLLPYDVNSQLFPIKIGTDTLFVKVPRDEAPSFKENFKSEYIVEQYDIVNDRIAVVGRTCKVGDKVYQTTNQYAKADNLNNLALNLPPLEMDFGNVSNNTSSQKPASPPVDHTIDQNIPASNITNSNTFAVIIGNENYSLVAKVPYAKNDAQVLAEYCRKTLGLPAKNVRTYGDATYAMMMTAVKDIQDIAKVYNGNINVVFYYAGHGIPDEQDKGAYLLPVDADGRQTSFCYPVSKLYQELGSMNVKSVVVLMDACFSGALRGDGMLVSARSVALKPKVEAPQGKMVVLTAASGDETAYPYEEKGHGMFTYFLLKKLRDTKGNCTLGELSDYIQSNVKQQSVVVNRKSQTPTISSSASIADSWKSMKLK